MFRVPGEPEVLMESGRRHPVRDRAVKLERASGWGVTSREMVAGTHDW